MKHTLLLSARHGGILGRGTSVSPVDSGGIGVPPMVFGQLRYAGIALAVLAGAIAAPAQPSGGTVLSGSATVVQDPTLTMVTADHNSILRWDTFDVASTHTVQFVQPSADARVLNWIGSQHASQIDGALRANGHVYLVNPAGVYFGATAIVDAARLYAIAGSFSKEDFLSGMDRFTDLRGEIRNDGALNASTVALIGRSVANRGDIVSPDGVVTLAAGDQVFLGRHGSKVYVDTGVSLAAEAKTGEVALGVNNSGLIDVGEGSIVLAAGDLFSVAISHTGALRGWDVQLQGQGGGRVVVDGRIDASSAGPGGTGGYVEVTGEHVQLLGEAVVDASGSSGGGTILIGGDAHGATETVRNAETTMVVPGATLLADAIDQGDGGKVIVWSDRSTRYGGALSARGGAAGGDGGFAEVSGGQLGFAGIADLRARAPGGRAGTLLLDPYDITISNASDFEVIDFQSGNYGSDGAGSNISWATILQALTTSNVAIFTSGSGNEAGNITIAESPGPGLYVRSNGLTLTTDTGDIIVDAPVINLGSGYITLDAGYGGSIILNGTDGATIVGTGGNLDLYALADIRGRGILAGNTVSLSAGDGIGTQAVPLATGTPSLYLTANTDNESFQASVQNFHDAGVAVGVGGFASASFVHEITSKTGSGAADAPLLFPTVESSSTFGRLRLWGSDVTLGDEGFSAVDLILGNSGALATGGGFTADTLIFENSGDVGTATERFFTDALTVVFNKTGGDAYVEAYGSESITVLGTSSDTLVDLLAESDGILVDIHVPTEGLSATTIALRGSNITLDGGLDSVLTTLVHAGDLSGPGTVRATSLLNLQGTGEITFNGGNGLLTQTPNIVFVKSGSGDARLTNRLDSGLTVSGTVGGYLDVFSEQAVGGVDAPLAIGALGLSAGEEISLYSGAITLLGDLVAAGVRFHNSGSVTRSAGTITGETIIGFHGEGDAGSAGVPLSTRTPYAFILQDGAVYLDNGDDDLIVSFFDGDFDVPAFTGGAFRGGAVTVQLNVPGSLDIGPNALSFTSARALDLGDVAITAGTLTLAHDGALLNYARPDVSTLVLGGAGNVGTAANPLRTAADALVLQKGAGASVYVENGNDGGLTLTGSNPLLLSLASLNNGYAAPAGLTIGAAGLSTGGTATLTSSTLALAGDIASPTLTVNAQGAVSGTGALVAATQLVLAGDGAVGSPDNAVRTQTPALVLNRPTGGVYIDNGTRALTLNPLAFGGGGAFLSGDFTLLGSIDAGANDLSLTSSGTLDLGGHAVRANRLHLAHDGALLASTGALTMSTLSLGGAGAIGSAENPFVFSAENLVLSKTGSASAFLENRRDLGLGVAGSAAGGLTLNSGDAAGASAAPLTIVSALGSTAPVSLASSTLALNADVTGSSLRLNHSGALSGSGVARATEALTLSGSGNVGTPAALVSIDTPAVVLEKPAGAVHLDNGTRTLALTPTAFTGGGVFRSGDFTLLGPIDVGSNALEFVGSGAVSLGVHRIAGGAIGFTTNEALTVSGLIEASQLILSGTGNVSIAGSAVPVVVINKTSGSVTVNNGTNDLSIQPTLASGGGSFTAGNISLLGSIDAGANSLSFAATGTLALNAFALRAERVTLSHGGALIDFGSLIATSLVLGGGGDFGSAANRASFSVAELELRKTGAASVYADNKRDAGLTLSGFAGGGTVSIGSLNAAGSASAQLTIGGSGLALTQPGTTATSLAGSGSTAADVPAGSVFVSGAAMTLTGGITADNLTVSNNGQVTGSGVLHASSVLMLENAGDVGAADAPVFANTPAIAINKSAGQVFIDNSGAPLVLTPIVFAGGGAISSGNLELLGPIDVGANALAFNTDGSLSLGTFSLTAGTITFNNSGELSGTGLVTADQLLLGREGQVGTIVFPLPFSGGPDDVVLNRSATGVNIGYFGGRGLALPPSLSPSVAAESRQLSLRHYDDSETGFGSDSDASLDQNSRRGGGAAFRAIAAKADLTAAAREQLQALGIYARTLTVEERAMRERKEAVFVTVPERERPQESDYEVVDARIDPVALRGVLRSAAETGLTEDGRSRLDEVSAALANTFERFSAVSPSVDATAYRAWLENQRDPDARVVLEFVHALHRTLNEIEQLGLTRQEIEVSKRQIFGGILRSRLNADPDFLRALIEPNGQVRAAAAEPTPLTSGFVLR